MNRLQAITRRIFRKRRLPAGERREIARLEHAVHYVFRDLTLLKNALLHKSFVNENRLGMDAHNERLEYLGDAVLELSISDLIMQHFPYSQEGILSKIRASLVNETSLAEVARSLNMGDYLFLSRGEEQSFGREKNSLLADAFEAVLGAIYLDGGFDAAYGVVRRIFLAEVERATKEDISRDYKTKLQEEVQTALHTMPQYRLVDETGPDHEKNFSVELSIKGQKISLGEGRSKKQAEQEAARQALEALRSGQMNLGAEDVVTPTTDS